MISVPLQCGAADRAVPEGEQPDAHAGDAAGEGMILFYAGRVRE